METGTINRSRNIMRIRNLTNTGIILALGTERLYLEPTRTPAIVRWSQNMIGSPQIQFGCPFNEVIIVSQSWFRQWSKFPMAVQVSSVYNSSGSDPLNSIYNYFPTNELAACVL